jgi:toxin-antitoxin system PIN domain toxin
MIALDANVLIYAHRPDYPLHLKAREAVEGLASGSGAWAIPWPCVHEFYSAVTNRRIHQHPSTPDEAWEQIDAWSESPTLRFLGEAHDHLARLRQLTKASGVVSAQVHDARIAAICLSHGVSELITMDRDFSRFPALRTRSLLA